MHFIAFLFYYIKYFPIYSCIWTFIGKLDIIIITQFLVLLIL